MQDFSSQLRDKLTQYKEVAQLFRNELPPSEMAKIDGVLSRLEHMRVEISAFGVTRAGKSALLNSLLGYSSRDPERPFGSSLEPNDWNDDLERRSAAKYKKIGDLEIVLRDTPGIGGDFPEHQSKAKQIAESSDVVIYVVWQAVVGAEQTTAMQALLDSRKPLIIAINKVDIYRPSEIRAIKDNLLKKMKGLIKEEMFVETAGDPIDGKPPIIDALVERITSVIHAKQESLIWDTVQRHFQNKAGEVAQIILSRKSNEAHTVIHSAAASAAAVSLALPSPTDAPFLSAIHVVMVQKLGRMFNQTISKAAAVAILGLVAGVAVGTTAVNVASSLFLPFGNPIRAVTTFAHTEALGWAAYAYFGKNYQPVPSL